MARGGCGIKVDYYSPRLYDDVGKTGSISASKYFKIGDLVTCSYETFGISDPDNGTLKICAVNGYRVASDSEVFTVKDYSNYTSHAFCHKSYIPRDLGAGWTGSAGVDGWCSEQVTMDTYKGGGANVSNGSSFTVSHSDTGVSASGTLTCNSGTWKAGSGSMTFDYTGDVKTFCVPYGLKDAGKSITFEAYGARGDPCFSTYGKGGYTKGVMSSSNYSDKQIFYIVVGQEGQLTKDSSLGSNAYNGGGKPSSYDTIGGYGGGGATHIATVNGVLSSLSENKSAVLLVAGGGGGNKYSTSGVPTCVTLANIAGYGGGNNNSGGSSSGKGGTSSSGGSLYGSNTTSGSFGKGGDCTTSKSFCAGGGGGYYGGGASSGSGSGNTGAGGGSGYCNTSKFSCSGSNGQRNGNGYVKISW